MTPKVFKVAVAAPLSGALSYAAPAEGAALLSRGESVRVPLGKRFVSGVVIATEQEVTSDFSLKPIHEKLPDRPQLSEPYLQWLEWLANYYLYPLGQITELVFPPLTKASKRKSRKTAPVPEVTPQSAPQLTREQEHVLERLRHTQDFAVHLLHGVTGSGKTEVYLQLLADTLAAGKRGLVLVPEISLTPQLLQRFSARFPQQVAVIHSQLTEREKTDQWWSVVGGDKRILVGARSALFCPVVDLGLIILDEEHEPSFKQDEKLKYHARDAAIMLAKYMKCPVVLGSATPSLETWQNVLTSRYQLHTMSKRIGDRELPQLEVVDLRQERAERKGFSLATESIQDGGMSLSSDMPFWLSRRLYEELKLTLARGEQAALFLNRRGLAQMALCPACGASPECPNCAVSLTVHANHHLVCHYCDYSQAFRAKCGECPDGEVIAMGLGTEKIEVDIQKLFPQARLARADRDEILNRNDLEQMIADVEHRRVDILIGTQMIAKGLDFPHLTLVGLVLADVGWHWPDFRASERAFQLITQVAGRSGRHSQQPGRVVIQTYNPQHASLLFACQHDFLGFSKWELSERQDLNYPPFGRLAMFRISAPTFEQAQAASQLLSARAAHLKSHQLHYTDLQLLGPSTAPLAKLRNKFRFQLLVKANSAKVLNAFCQQVLADSSWVPNQTKIQVDIDPINML